MWLIFIALQVYATKEAERLHEISSCSCIVLALGGVNSASWVGP